MHGPRTLLNTLFKHDDMPSTQLEFPILLRFLCAVEINTGMPLLPLDAKAPSLAETPKKQRDDERPKQLPKGVVLGPDGKPYVMQLILDKVGSTDFVSDAAHAHPSHPGRR